MSIRTAARAAATTAVLAAVTLLGAPNQAQALQPTSALLAPGQQRCVSQQAYYQVRASGTATQDGAKFKLKRYINPYFFTVVANTMGLANSFYAEFRTSYGNFPGSGLYELCATNNGTRNTYVTLHLQTDAELGW